MRADANKIALIAVRAILDGARPVTIEVAGTKVACGVTRAEQPAWPEYELRDLDPTAASAGWPRPVRVACKWDGGQCELEVACEFWRKTRYDGLIGLGVRTGRPSRHIVWMTVPTCIGDADDGTSRPLRSTFALAKRRKVSGS